MRQRYRVLDADAQSVTGQAVTPERMVDLTAREARYPLDQGLIEPAPAPSPPVIEDAPRHPLDHDGDGRKGGSLPGPRRRRAVPAAPIPEPETAPVADTED
ncbi:MAG: hypothetical protein Q8M31_21660 [Beijerinckiaceae bacterium]|nr:hypothetical protein [Beijerinckiaceae bacterium]